MAGGDGAPRWPLVSCRLSKAPPPPPGRASTCSTNAPRAGCLGGGGPRLAACDPLAPPSDPTPYAAGPQPPPLTPLGGTSGRGRSPHGGRPQLPLLLLHLPHRGHRNPHPPARLWGVLEAPPSSWQTAAPRWFCGRDRRGGGGVFRCRHPARQKPWGGVAGVLLGMGRRQPKGRWVCLYLCRAVVCGEARRCPPALPRCVHGAADAARGAPPPRHHPPPHPKHRRTDGAPQRRRARRDLGKGHKVNPPAGRPPHRRSVQDRKSVV